MATRRATLMDPQSHVNDAFIVGKAQCALVVASISKMVSSNTAINILVEATHRTKQQPYVVRLVCVFVARWTINEGQCQKINCKVIT